MSVAARGRTAAATVAAVAACSGAAATACVVPGAVLCATATYWATLLQVYPGGEGAAAIVWLLLAAALLFGAAAVASVTGFLIGAGAWSQRLRGAPLAAVLALFAATGALLLAIWAVTGDPGLRAPATAVVASAALVAAALLAHRAPHPDEWNLHRLGPVELQMIVAVGMAATLVIGLLAQPWETAELAGAAATPVWQFMAVVLAVGAFAGQFLLQMLRRPGVGVMALMVAFGMRALLIGILQQPIGGFEGAAPAYLLAMATAGIMDLIYFFNLGRAGEARVAWQALTSAVTAMLLGSLFFLEDLVPYPPVNAETIPGIVAVGALAGFGGGWLGMVAGRWSAGQRRLAASAGARWLEFAGLGLTAAALVAVVAWAARLAG